MTNLDVSSVSVSPVYKFTVETNDVSAIISLVHRLNIGRHRMAGAQSRHTNPLGGRIEPIGPTYAEQYDVSPADLGARGAPLGDLCDLLTAELSKHGVDVL